MTAVLQAWCGYHATVYRGIRGVRGRHQQYGCGRWRWSPCFATSRAARAGLAVGRGVGLRISCKVGEEARRAAARGHGHGRRQLSSCWYPPALPLLAVCDRCNLLGADIWGATCPGDGIRAYAGREPGSVQAQVRLRAGSACRGQPEAVRQWLRRRRTRRCSLSEGRL